jgi:hypothetical protein
MGGEPSVVWEQLCVCGSIVGIVPCVAKKHTHTHTHTQSLYQVYKIQYTIHSTARGGGKDTTGTKKNRLKNKQISYTPASGQRETKKRTGQEQE